MSRFGNAVRQIVEAIQDKPLPEIQIQGFEELKIFEGCVIKIAENGEEKYYHVRGVDKNFTNGQEFAVLYSEVTNPEKVRVLEEKHLSSLTIYSVRESEIAHKSFFK